MSTRSITPRVSCSEPIGISVATTCGPKAALSDVERAEEVGPLAVEHVHEDRAGRRRARRRAAHSRCVETSTPITALTTNTADSQTRSAPSASATNDGSPGVSMRLTFTSRQVEGGQRRRDRHPARLLVVVGVRDRRAVRHRAEPGRRAGLEQQGLVQRRLPAPPVAHQGHVADPVGGDWHAWRSSPAPGKAGRRPAVRDGRPWTLDPCSRPAPATQRRQGAQSRRLSPCSRDLSRSTAFVCSCEMRDSVTPRTSPISRRVRFS